ncbi:right-handed parallel beta-helix repeat-containing protein [Nannocystis bainbridge]|uniref:Right-handed parallel beta-helix repeat-containing protein n=1 Tax=Nannocystis bainbridge TaxID=2995303 RepID=A0ABT5E391_9BACT|nr:right-handed parallel beta-helix repeat-containing protein [Nannocystis bainbridge]MDC0719870.1 right-handed parallel beta-helix repeat-containing protein [Nannocystis bainbridge]
MRRTRSSLPLALTLAGCSVEIGQPTDTSTSEGSATTESQGESTTGTSTVDPTGAPTTSTASTSSTSTGTTEAATTDVPAETDGPVLPGCGDESHFATFKQPTTLIHVATDGADGPDCGGEATPCQTLAAAAAKATPGTGIRLLGETFGPDIFLTDLAGTEDAPIWIGGEPNGTRPLISGGGEGLHLSRVRHLVLHDLEITGATSNGINVDDGGDVDDPEATRFVAFERLYIHDIGQGGNQDCLKLSGVHDFWVLGSQFERCGAGGSGIDHVGCHRGLLVGNWFHDNGGNAIQTKGGSEDIEIRGNTMVDCGQRAVNMGGSTGFEFFRPPLTPDGVNAEARNIRVVSNVIEGGEVPLAFVGCVDCLAAHNTIIRPQQWLLRILQETVTDQQFTFAPASGGRFFNNLVLFDRAEISTHVNIGGDTAPETFSFASNLWFAADAPDQSSPAGDLPVVETDPLTGVDPLLVNLTDDYRLTPASPALGTGTPLPEVVADRDGLCWRDPPSRGAYELH